jgi:hypothetical protein
VSQIKDIPVSRIITAPTPTVTPQGTTGAATWTYRLVALDADGHVSAVGTAGSTATGNATLTGVNFNRITWTDPSGDVASIRIYRTAVGTSPTTTGLIGTVLAGVQTFDDTGLAGDASTAPAADTTGIGKAIDVLHLWDKAVQFSGEAGAAWSATVKIQGSLDGHVWEDIGAAVVGTDTFRDIARTYALIRAVETAYTSGTPKVTVAGHTQ